MILALKTNTVQAQLYLLKKSGEVISEYEWEAGKTLADSLLIKINNFLKKNSIGFEDLKGICIYSGEGSFTGLRIGTTVANTLSYGLNIRVFKASGKNWLKKIPKIFNKTKTGKLVIPDYNKLPNITKPN